jgi:prevent-host-death family protein
MCDMNGPESDNSISIRDLQRNAAHVLSQVEHGASFTVTRHGRTVGRLLPPDPATEAVNRAVADGLLDAADLVRARTAQQVARTPREPASAGGQNSLSDALARLREDEH